MAKAESKITLPKKLEDDLAASLRKKLKADFDADVGQFEALGLLDWLSETLGPHFYNQGLADAQEIYRKKFEDIADDVFALEKPVKP